MGWVGSAAKWGDPPFGGQLWPFLMAQRSPLGATTPIAKDQPLCPLPGLRGASVAELWARRWAALAGHGTFPRTATSHLRVQVAFWPHRKAGFSFTSVIQGLRRTREFARFKKNGTPSPSCTFCC